MICSARDWARASELHDLPRLPLDEAMDYDGDAPALIVDAAGLDADDACAQLMDLTSMIYLPLVFDGDDEAVLKAVLRAYPGAAGVVGRAGLAAECGAVAL